ncbi:hypothetical protein H9X85_05490 [Anaerotignum lactatifermentans]|uniref:Uncharacterized protein n=1 Tax=Anaerotignum lactatifermentans TaxID=160404 RepID=A0ABS2G9V6_9FIRM|nr:hypothetical protein [Anaerotignum lactatifermentans]MBM6829098.1 hypothetical protein [Anaerotignum lactatifermentans]MBM6877294.1 hypothetical protein [Anaerotignum lactatifermentans]MBM6950666.1 hypothetical protein [Anaerotignum lactatifermentans]
MAIKKHQILPAEIPVTGLKETFDVSWWVKRFSITDKLFYQEQRGLVNTGNRGKCRKIAVI